MLSLRRLPVLALALSAAAAAQSPVLTEDHRIESPNTHPTVGFGLEFGVAAATLPDGRTVAVAADLSEQRPDGDYTGGAYVYRLEAVGWLPDTGDDGRLPWAGLDEPGAHDLGRSVALSSGALGTFAVVGEPRAGLLGPFDPEHGRAQVFRRLSDGVWTRDTMLVAGASLDVQRGVGKSAAAVEHGGELWALLGERGSDAFLFARTPDDAGALGAWRYEHWLTTPDRPPTNEGDAAVALASAPDALVALIGDRTLEGPGGDAGGGAHLHERDAETGDWTGPVTLQEVDGDPVTGDRYGRAVELAVTAGGDVLAFVSDGFSRVWVYRRLSVGAWELETRLEPSPGPEGYTLGASLSVVARPDGSVVVVAGARWSDHSGLFRPGQAYVFHRSAGGAWTERARLRAAAPEAFDQLGRCVSVTAAGRVLVGGPYAGPGADGDHGAVLSYDVSAVVPVVAEAEPEGALAALTARPNPARGWLVIEVPAADLAGATLVVYDALGRAVAERRVPPGGGQTELDVSVWAPGAYVVRVSSAAWARAERVSVVQ